MKDDGLILKAWAEASRAGLPAVLATVVRVSGSAYRRPGARMLITEAGGRTGSVSGGCLEGDILKKAWWLTENGQTAVQVYDNTTDNETAWEIGLGCNGVIHILLERWEAGSEPPVARLLKEVQAGVGPGSIATVVEGPLLGEHFLTFPDGTVVGDPALASRIAEEHLFVEALAPPVPLLIAGSDHDVLPMVRMAKDLGWQVTIADTRSQQARAERFPSADRVLLCDLGRPLESVSMTSKTVAVVMGHSYPQDKAFVMALLPHDLRYIGVLGPRKRTERMFEEAGLPVPFNLHSPVGLDIGADTSEEIALSIVSEIQAVLASRGAGMLRNREGPIHLR